uniref:G_PROTEIN_RECEP_F1_2 domain-containing protein n=1 Tax=Syphacia muris TaxID=451379 RepID=A0A0N5AAJ3_9BILA
MRSNLSKALAFANSSGTIFSANPITFFAIITQRSLRSPTNVFLAALSVVDFLVGVFCVGQNAIHLSYINEGTWPLGSQACKIYIYFIHMLPSVSAGLLVLLSLERMIAVKFPLFAAKIFKYSITIPSTVLVWICAEGIMDN